jgi:hypothetical protein
VHKTSAGCKLPPVGRLVVIYDRRKCLQKRCGGRKVNKFREENVLIFSYINGGKQLLLYIQRELI